MDVERRETREDSSNVVVDSFVGRHDIPPEAGCRIDVGES